MEKSDFGMGYDNLPCALRYIYLLNYDMTDTCCHFIATKILWEGKSNPENLLTHEATHLALRMISDMWCRISCFLETFASCSLFVNIYWLVTVPAISYSKFSVKFLLLVICKHFFKIESAEQTQGLLATNVFTFIAYWQNILNDGIPAWFELYICSTYKWIITFY